MAGILKKLVLAVLVVLAALAYRWYNNQTYPVSFSFWNATDQDIAEAFVHDLNGVLLYEEEGFVPASIGQQGWITGSGATTYWKQFPDVVMVSWRKASPQETAAQRCRRRMEQGCEKLGVPGRVMHRDGELVGPFRVDLRQALSADVWSLYRRFGVFNDLAFGLSVGVDPIQVRWVLHGAPKGSSAFDTAPGVDPLAYGGDWGPYRPWGFDSPSTPIPPRPVR